MDSPGPAPADLAPALRRVCSSLAAGLQYRFELLALELREESRRVLSLLLGALAIAGALFMAFLCLNAALLILFWDDHRVPLVVGLCLFYATVAVALGVFVRRKSKAGSAPFAATFEELKKDRMSMGPER